MSGVVCSTGKLNAVIREVEAVMSDIRNGRIPSVARDRSGGGGQHQQRPSNRPSGTRVGVSYCCDRLRSKNLGAERFNLPVSGAYHSSLMLEASDFLRPASSTCRYPTRKVSHSSLRKDGRVLPNSEAIREDLQGIC